jgi:hypothetical protein
MTYEQERRRWVAVHALPLVPRHRPLALTDR